MNQIVYLKDFFIEVQELADHDLDDADHDLISGMFICGHSVEQVASVINQEIDDEEEGE